VTRAQPPSLGGKRLPKDDLRIEAYGTIDELNAQLGLLAVSCKLPEWEIRLANIQSLLFTIGAHLAADPEKSDLKLPPIPEGNELELESLIDEMEASLPPLKNFVLPGGNTASALAHVCRTICRRARTSRGQPDLTGTRKPYNRSLPEPIV
jgi:cob(I)alamin adenosyltransferase